MSAPRLLDLFCGAGGAAMGYHRAGFEVVGVDLNPQPHYPFEFHQADAVEVLDSFLRSWWAGGRWHLKDFAAVHASPPCQAYSVMSSCRPGLADTYDRLVDDVRDRLRATGLPFVIENVPGAGLATTSDLFGVHGVTLCGSMFNLALYRHRVFESNFLIRQLDHPPHAIPASKAGHWRPGTIMSVSGHCSPIEVARTAMGIDWMPRNELAEAIPPAYTHYIGATLRGAMRSAA